MKITLKQLWDGQNGLSTLFDAKFQNVKSAYWISRVTKKVIAEFEQLEKSRKVLLEKHDLQKGKPCPPEKEEIFKKEFDDLLAAEIEVSFDKIKFEYIQEVKFSPKELASLDWLIEEPS